MASIASACAERAAVRRPRLEVADVFAAHVAAFLRDHPVSPAQRQVIAAILACRTAVLGGHLDACDTCGHTEVSYNSCRNRHCPKCQVLSQTRWIAQRQERVLEVPHFHVVFTLPAELRPLCRANQGPLYDLLFEAAAQSLLALGHDPRHLGAQLGITQVLHTWARDLSYHPHVHCIVTGGGLSFDGTRWVPKDGRFLFPLRPLSQVFRGKFLQALRARLDRGGLLFSGRAAPLAHGPALEVLLQQLYQKDWVVYAKRAFGGAGQVFAYLGRYTHRVGLSNHRLLRLDSESVCFKTRAHKTATLSGVEFIRRFLLHVLPRGFVKIRHCGLLSSSGVKTRLPLARALLLASRPAAPAAPAPSLASSPPSPTDLQPAPGSASGVDVTPCPVCQQGHMLRRLLLTPCRRAHRPMVSAPSPAPCDSS